MDNHKTQSPESWDGTVITYHTTLDNNVLKIRNNGRRSHKQEHSLV